MQLLKFSSYLLSSYLEPRDGAGCGKSFTLGALFTGFPYERAGLCQPGRRRYSAEARLDAGIIKGMRFALLLLAGLPLLAADASIMEEIICKVNGDIITRTELARDRKSLEADLRQQGLTGARLQDAIKTYSGNLLRERIDKLLLQQKGKELNLNVDSDVNKQMADIQKRAATQTPSLADPEKFQQFVREQTGMPFEDYKAEMKNSLITQRVIREEVGRRINVKKEEVRAYYDQHKNEFERQERVFLREIFVAISNKDDANAVSAAEKKAKDLAARAKKGERFPDLAQNNSDSQTAQQGGALDPYKQGELAPELEKLVWDKERGAITDPIRLPNGFLILKVDDHQKAGLAVYEEVENEIQDRIVNGRMEPALRAYLTKLREDAFLEIKPGYEDSGAAPGKDTTWVDPAQLKPETITKEEVAAKNGSKKHLFGIPIPGTHSDKPGTSSSR
jgi:peptidyl-prolyl cis-trans isomerase SurA